MIPASPKITGCYKMKVASTQLSLVHFSLILTYVTTTSYRSNLPLFLEVNEI